jgi:hypothetical protein
MTIAALITWIITASGGLLLLSIWLIEYDREYQSAAATRLPVPVLSAHALLAVGGLAIWVIYLFTDSQRLAYLTIAILGVVVALGATMALRWAGVYRRFASAPRLRGRPGAELPRAWAVVPPERHFPLPVVVGHGLFALATVTLVLLTLLRPGGS